MVRFGTFSAENMQSPWTPLSIVALKTDCGFNIHGKVRKAPYPSGKVGQFSPGCPHPRAQ